MSAHSQVLSVSAAVDPMMHHDPAASIALQDAAFSQSSSRQISLQPNPTAVDLHPDATRAIYDFMCGKRD